MDPSQKVDTNAWVLLSGRTIQEVRYTPFTPEGNFIQIDGRGHILATAFVDLNVHGVSDLLLELKAMDGVSAILEGEGGTANFRAFVNDFQGKSPIHFAATAGHLKARSKLFGQEALEIAIGNAAYARLDGSELAELRRILEEQILAGAFGLGFALAYAPGASYYEVLKTVEILEKYKLPVHIHLRSSGGGSLRAYQEIFAACVTYDIPLHVVHLNSIGGSAADVLYKYIQLSKAKGYSVSTEFYPFNYAMTSIQAPFIRSWTNSGRRSWDELYFVDGDAYLNSNSAKVAMSNGGWVIFKSQDESVISNIAEYQDVWLASDATLWDGKGHPRSSSTYSQFWQEFVVQKKMVTPMQAIERMSTAPNQHLMRYSANYSNRGSVSPGFFSDLVLIDKDGFKPRASYTNAALASEGVSWLWVNGRPVVREGVFQKEAHPGEAILSRAVLRDKTKP